jgi:hypothetical protein
MWLLLFLLPASLLSQVPLFDGKTLHGWSVREGPESAFYVQDGEITGSVTSGFPAWLRSDRQYENFDLELEFFIKGWNDGGVYFHAPKHGPRSRSGFKISLFHQVDKDPRANSMGSIFPVVAPKLVNVRNQGQWNQLRIRMDWPRLTVWTNGEIIHELDVESVPELRYRLRQGYLGLETLSYPIRFRNIRIRELPSKQAWEALYAEPSDLEKWTLTESNERTPARYEALGAILRGDGLGNLTSKEKYRDFELQMYIRGSRHHNGGILFRSQGGRNRYEIQLHDVEEAHYPTGSLYFFQRSIYPRIQAEQWFLFQLIVQDRRAIVRINGETVLDYGKLENLEAGSIELQAHQAGRWIEYKDIRVRRLGEPK